MLANEAVVLPLAKSACGDVPSIYVVANMRTPYMRLGVGTVVGCEEGEPLGWELGCPLGWLLGLPVGRPAG